MCWECACPCTGQRMPWHQYTRNIGFIFWNVKNYITIDSSALVGSGKVLKRCLHWPQFTLQLYIWVIITCILGIFTFLFLFFDLISMSHILIREIHLHHIYIKHNLKHKHTILITLSFWPESRQEFYKNVYLPTIKWIR